MTDNGLYWLIPPGEMNHLSNWLEWKALKLLNFIISAEFMVGGMVGALISAVLFVMIYTPDDSDAPYPWEIERKKKYNEIYNSTKKSE